MLEIRGLNAAYGSAQVLWDIDMDVREGEIVAVMGPNGSGKSTILKAIMGLIPDRTGRVLLNGQDISRTPSHKMVRAGVSLVLERRRLFPAMTVAENIQLGAVGIKDPDAVRLTRAWVEELFPIVAARRNQLAGTMSGGEQQMVAIARGLMCRPKLLLLDEPFLGLAPKIVNQVIELVRLVNKQGISVMFNEQNVHLSFSNAHRGYVLEGGKIRLQGSGLSMLENDVVRQVYLGHGARK